MKKIIIEISDAQHQKLINEITRCRQINFQEETFSGMELILGSTFDGALTDLSLKMHSKMDLGDVDWCIE